MSLDALPEFLISVFWTPLLIIGGLMWCFAMGFALLSALHHMGKSFTKGG